MLTGKDILSIDDFERGDFDALLKLAAQYDEKGIPVDLLRGHVCGALFFEASTRTRLSFETAMQRLGAGVVGFADPGATSQKKKGESFEDTIRMVSGYVDAIVMRHPEAGAAARAAAVASVPVINAGDGANEHPTQTLLDLYAIQTTQGEIDGKTIAMVGDLKYGRVPHSLAKALTKFDGVKQIWVAPDSLQMPDQYTEAVERAGGEYVKTDSMQEALAEADIVYMTRVQAERFDDPTEYERVKDVYIVTPEMLEEAGPKKHMRILHALPRIVEIPTSIDETPYAYYFEQAAGGVPVRAALLASVLTE